MMELVKVERPALDQATYCVMPIVDQVVWEEKGDTITKAMPLLMNSKNDNAKKDLCLAYSHGNKSACPLTAKTMARYMSKQYHNKNTGH